MASGVWSSAQALLREAADTIEARSAGRDEDGRPDTIALAAIAEGLTEAQVLAAMLGIKRIRLSRGRDHDSAVDLLAYEARRLVALLAQVPQTDPTKWGPPMDPPEHHAVDAPMPPTLTELLARAEDDDGPDGLKAGEAYRNPLGEDAE